MSEIPEFLDQDPVFDNDPMSNEPMPWYQVWIAAITKPNEENFRKLAALPNAKPSTAYLWIFLAYMVTFAVVAVAQIVIGLPNMADQFSELGMESLPVADMSGSLVGLICITPFVAGFSILGFMIGTALIQWAAKLFGGTGSYDKLAYVFGAIQAPMMLASSVFVLLAMIPFVGMCFSIFSLGISIYMLVLQVLAVKAVNNFDTGKAIGSVLLPGLVFFLFICCCFVIVIGGLTAVSPAIGDIFSEINQNLY